ncbi:M56 family metallopeptidase [Hymenobacter sp. UYCo722]|uniref:M56 family metallopeptidase n=1 Tax=Hymenobacter sp. UYCo722 TaxID=3156335 RepID=UPI003394AC99
MAASTTILLYLLKANGALLLVAAAYFGLLRRLTFFTLNRAYLVLALLFAALYPALPVPALLPAEATPAVFFPVVGSAEAPITTTVLSAPAVDWAAVGVALYAVGAAVVLVRLLLQLLALARLRWRSRPALVQGHTVRVLAGEISPFSFGRSIYLNPDQHPGPELAAVLRHERVHVRQWHTLDVLLAQLALAAAWCNPAAWLLRRALLENLEFLADAAVLEAGLDRRAYQYSLLRLSHAPAGPSLVSHFTFPTLKNRVVMMNTPLSSSGQLARYFVAGPLVLAVALGISGARAQSGGPMGPAAAAATPAASANNLVPTAKAPAIPTATASAVGPATPQLPDGIQAYIAKTYPGSSISSYFVADHASGKAPHVQYYASVTTRNGEKRKLYFNSAEQPVAGPNLVAPAPAAMAAEPTPRASSLGNSYYHYGRPTPVVYLDGQRYSGDINDIGPENIANISMFKGEEARRRFGTGANEAVVVVTTSAKQNDADVRAFNERVGAGVEKPTAPTATPAPAVASGPYLAAPALAYITQHYPGARLLGVAAVPAPDGGPTRYQAQIVLGRRPGYLLFDAAGQFISDSYSSSVK